jgi:hypothetical protein
VLEKLEKVVVRVVVEKETAAGCKQVDISVETDLGPDAREAGRNVTSEVNVGDGHDRYLEASVRMKGG